MLDDNQLKGMIKNARDGFEKRNFTQSAELTLILKDIDVKKGFSLNEVVSLPHKSNHESAICLIGSGDLAMRARKVGIATILEMMAMGKCVIATRTRGQTDTIVDGETGIYVPPPDPLALRSAIERMLEAPDEAQRIGERARRFLEENAGLDHFVRTIVDAVRSGHARRTAA